MISTLPVRTFPPSLLTLLHIFLIASVIASMAQYNNAVLSITSTATPDPYVTYANNKFYLVRGNLIFLYGSNLLT